MAFFIDSQHQGLFQWVSSSHQVAKVGASASASVLPVNIQGWYPLYLPIWPLFSALKSGFMDSLCSTTFQIDYNGLLISRRCHIYTEMPHCHLSHLGSSWSPRFPPSLITCSVLCPAALLLVSVPGELSLLPPLPRLWLLSLHSLSRCLLLQGLLQVLGIQQWTEQRPCSPGAGIPWVGLGQEEEVISQ